MCAFLADIQGGDLKSRLQKSSTDDRDAGGSFLDEIKAKRALNKTDGNMRGNRQGSLMDQIKQAKLKSTGGLTRAPQPSVSRPTNPMDELRAKLAKRMMGDETGDPAPSAKPTKKSQPAKRLPPPAATPPVTEESLPDYAQQVRAFYAEHNPKKLSEVDNLLEKYAGREEILLRKLRKKYKTASAAVAEPTGIAAYRADVVSIYAEHNPEKLSEVDMLMAKYAGREKVLIRKLKKKYMKPNTATKLASKPKTESAPSLAPVKAEISIRKESTAAPNPPLKPALKQSKSNIIESETAAVVSVTPTWTEHSTVDGRAYYVSADGETTWEKPECLMSAEELAEQGGEWIWAPHPELAYVPAKVMERTCDDGANVVIMDTGEEVQLSGKVYNAAAKISSLASLRQDRADLVQLDDVNKPSILHLLRERFMRKAIYTSVGDILVSVNPFERLPLYTPTVMGQYIASGGDELVGENPPHPFLIANACYSRMVENSEDQAILISGESGAGKTETVKQCLQYLTEVAGDERGQHTKGGTPSTGVSDMLMAANPILEAFGNAKTLRNDNSSRFGKWMEIAFDSQTHRMKHCSITDYLLEKTRVVYHAAGERNYHVFYLLCEAATHADALATEEDALDADFKLAGGEDQHLDVGSLCAALKLSGGASSFHYLQDAESGKGGGALPKRGSGVNELQEMRDLLHAMAKMGFHPAEVRVVVETTAAVLHIGNADFGPGDGGQGAVLIGGRDALITAAELLGIGTQSDGADILVAAMSAQHLTIRGEAVTRELTPEQAADARDALAKAIYGHLFEWLVDRLNVAMCGSEESSDGSDLTPALNVGCSIGILDIFGFEIFESNGFEQLCINYANEKLQQHFNRHTFNLEEDTYKSEGVHFDHIEYIDSQPVLDLIESKSSPTGLLVLLDDEINVPKATDETFLHKLSSKFGASGGAQPHPNFSDRCRSKTAFKIKHYAGDVVYDVSGFLEKNRDRLVEDLQLCVFDSSSPFLQQLFVADKEAHDIEVRLKKRSSSSSSAPEPPAPLNVAVRVIKGIRILSANRRRRSSAAGTGSLPRSGGSRSKVRTQGTKFKLQLQFLMTKLETTFPHYIRCIKPNQQKLPGTFDAPLVLQQLMCAGVLEAITIRKRGYPFRHSHHGFYRRFRWLACPAWAVGRGGGTHAAASRADARAKVWPAERSDYSAACTDLIATLEGEVAKEVKFGKTMVLYRADTHRELELQLAVRLSSCACTVQATARRFLVKRRVAELIPVRNELRVALKSRELRRIEKALASSRAVGGFFLVREHYECVGCMDALAEEEALRPRITAIVGLDAEAEIAQYEPIVTAIKAAIEKDSRACQWDEALTVLRKYGAVVGQQEARTAAADALTERYSVADEPVDGALSPVEVYRRLTAAAEKIDALHAEHGDVVEDSFLRAAQRRCKARAARIAAETKLASDIFSWFTPEYAPRGDPGKLNVDAVQGEVVAVLRSKLIAALDSNALSAKDQPWVEVEASLTLCTDIVQTQCPVPVDVLRSPLSAATDAVIPGAGAMAGAAGITAELACVCAELGYRGEVDDVMSKLEEAMQTLFEASLETALGQAAALGMAEHSDDTVRAAVADAEGFLAAVRHAASQLTESLEADSVTADALGEALDYANSFGFGDEGRAGQSLVASAAETKAYIDALTIRADDAAVVIEVDLMKSALADAAEVRLKEDSVPSLGVIASLLALSKDRLMQEQLRAATKLGDTARCTRLTIAIKSDFLDKSSALFRLENFPLLKPREEWGRKFGMFNEKLAEGMLRWSKHGIHTSLTKIQDPDPEGVEDPQHKQLASLKKTAKKLFKNILGYCGEKHYEGPNELASELLDTCLKTPQLRDEIFVQLMKQLTGNGGVTDSSKRRAWSLMTLCCATFPPSEQLSNYLEVFLREAAGEGNASLAKLHETMYSSDPRQNAPSSAECGRVRSMRGDPCSVSFKGALPR